MKNYCSDLVHLTGSIEPVGSIFIGLNSVGAGASQNNIHCHAWPYPSIDSKRSKTENEETEDGVFFYPVNNVHAIYDFYNLQNGKVEVSFLKYPFFLFECHRPLIILNYLVEHLVRA